MSDSVESDLVAITTSADGNWVGVNMDPATGEYVVQADVVWDGDLHEDIQSYAREFGVKAIVLNESGPGGGWPVVEFRGTPNAIRALLVSHYDDPALANIGL